MKTYRDTDEYIAVNGGESLIGTSIFTQSSHERNIDASQKVLLDKLHDIEARNQAAREKMLKELDKGEIRFMTPVEKLELAANGHEDNEATHAARRCLKKRGICHI